MEIGVFSAILQGLIQGLTEFLPISSSGHLSLFQFLTGQSGEGSVFFGLMLHLGTLAAVVSAFYEDLWAMLKEVGRIVKELFTGRFRAKTDSPSRKMLYMLFFACLPMVLVIPLRWLLGGVAGDGDIIVEGVCFLVTSGLLFAACKKRRGTAGIMRMKPRHALFVGLAQAVATLPGISRSGATISTGMILGFDKGMMVKFSFLMGIPAILGGAVFEIGDAAKEQMNIPWWILFIGMLTAAVVGYAAIRLVRWLVKTDRFIAFAWYTLALGVLVVALGIIFHLVGWGGSAVSAWPASSVSGAFAV